MSADPTRSTQANRRRPHPDRYRRPSLTGGRPPHTDTPPHHKQVKLPDLTAS